MVNWITQSTEWLSTVLPSWNAVLQYMMEYTWLDLVNNVIVDPLRTPLSAINPSVFRVWDIISGWLATTDYGELTIVSWLIMSSAIIMMMYMAVYFIKWIIGIIA